MFISETKNTWVFALLACFIGFLYGFTPIADTDAWMHLSLGRYLAEQGIPEFEPFAFTAENKPFFFSSTLYALLSYFAYSIGGYSVVVLFKSMSSAALALAIYLITKAKTNNVFIAFFITIAAIVLLKSRLVLRPEILSYALMLFAFYAIVSVKRHQLLFIVLPVIIVLWANIHSSVILFIVPILYGLAYYGVNLNNRKQIQINLNKTTLLAFFFLLVVSFGSALLNPNGIDQFFYGSTVIDTPFYKEQISELKPASFSGAPLFFSIAAIILLMQLTFAIVAFFKRKITTEILLDTGLILSFYILFLTSVRFFFLYIVIAAPVVGLQIRNLLSVAPDLNQNNLFQIKVASVLSTILLAILFMPNIGLSMDNERVPAGSIDKIKKIPLESRLVNSFDFGGYLIWELYPRYKVSIDPRGAIEPELLESNFQAHYDFNVLSNLSTTHDVNLAVFARKLTLYGIQDAALHGFPNPDWALIYWDDNSMLLAKRAHFPKNWIAENEYTMYKPDMAGYVDFNFKQNESSRFLTELNRHAAETNSIDSQVSIAKRMLDYQKYEPAEELIKNLISNKSTRAQALGLYLSGKLNVDRKEYELAYKDFKSSSKFMQTSNTFYYLAATSERLKKYKDALDYVNQGLKRLPYHNPSIQMKARILKSIGGPENLALSQRLIEASNQVELSRQYISDGINAYNNNDLKLAEQLYNKVLEIEPNSEHAFYNLAIVAKDLGRFEEAISYYEKAASISAKMDRGYFQIALIYRNLQKHELAKIYFEKFVQLRPTGALSRDARAFLDEYQSPQ